MPQVLEAAGETRPIGWVLSELAHRLDVTAFYPWENDEGPIDAILDHPATGHATVATLRAEGGIRALNISHVANPDLRFHTPSRKIEFYSERAQGLGLPPLPVHEEPDALPGTRSALRQGRTLTQFHGFYDNGRALPTLAAADPEPLLWISRGRRGRARREGRRCDPHLQRARRDAVPRTGDRRYPAGTVWMRDGWPGLNRSLTALR